MEAEIGKAQKNLAKELGIVEALTIGVGTMIGAGIFVLPRYAIEMVGPGAILPYLLAGLICLITANSIAELATGMPKSGGTYYFVSRSLGNFVGTISGLSLWLSLTFAVAFYLQGFGEYLGLFLPFNQTILALAAGVFFTYINYIGAKETGRTQNIIVGILIPILFGYILWGFYNSDVSLWTPFLPEGYGSVFPATAIIFVSFLGFEQIASVAEEIKNPGRTLPRAIMGSVGIVLLLYIPVIMVTTGIIPYGDIAGLETPIVDVARLIAGTAGAIAITIAALLATASSANASIMASSRINFAMGRDSILPAWLNKVHPDFLTPYRPIIATGILTLILVVVADVEALSSSASVLMLLNYSIINLTVIIMRIAPPADYKPSYRSIGYPYLHIIGAIISLVIIFGAGFFAQIAAIVLVLMGFVWYFSWSKKHANLKAAVADIEFSQIFTFKPVLDKTVPEKGEITEPVTPGISKNLRILTPLANPDNEKSLLNLSGQLIKHSGLEGEIMALHVVEIPEQTPLDFMESQQDFLKEGRLVQKNIMDIAIEFGQSENVMINPRILYSRDKFRTIINLIKQENFDFLILGWHGSLSMGDIYNSFVNRLVREVPCPVGVLKDKGLKKVEKILVPYRGSEHAYFGVEFALKLVARNKGLVTILRVVKPGVDLEQEKEKAFNELKPLFKEKEEGTDYRIITCESETVVEGIITECNKNEYNLTIMGASKEWRLKNLLFGSIPDIIAEKAPNSVLLIRQQEQAIKFSRIKDDQESVPEKF